MIHHQKNCHTNKQATSHITKTQPYGRRVWWPIGDPRGKGDDLTLSVWKGPECRAVGVRC